MTEKFKVLIVEDEFLTAQSLKMDLEKLGLDVLKPIPKGEDAVPIAIQENPNLILMDIRLAGGLDGIEAAEEILLKNKIPIVFMTGYATEEIKERALQLNPIDYLEKPVDMHKIGKIINTLKNE